MLYQMSHRTHKLHHKRVKSMNKLYTGIAITCSHVMAYIIIIIYHHDLLPCYSDKKSIACDF
jgi:hypothetical protein